MIPRRAGWGLLILLAVAWLALDDITTGTQSSFALEWTVVGVASLAVLLVAAALARRGDHLLALLTVAALAAVALTVWRTTATGIELSVRHQLIGFAGFAWCAILALKLAFGK